MNVVLQERPDYVIGVAPEGVLALCPITGLPFHSIERNPTGEGYVPTYGGPFESYTIPECKDGELRRYHYDHDWDRWEDGTELVTPDGEED